MTQITDLALTDLPDLTNQATFVDAVPHEAFDRIRATPGLYWQPAASGTAHGGFWVLTRTADCLAVEKNPDLFTSSRGAVWPMTNFDGRSKSPGQLMYMDPPKHSSVRRVVAKAFGPRVVAHFDPWVREIVTDAIDDMVSTDGPFDYVQKAAIPIPSRVVARVMGIPKADESIIIDSATELFAASQLGDSDTVMATNRDVHAKINRFVKETLMPMKRQAPADDMSTALTESMDNGELTESECLDFHQLLINAGFETTHTVIAQCMRMIVEDPDVAEKTFHAIDQIGTGPVIDEFLRLITPAMHFARTATRDAELAGQAIRKDDLVVMYFVAANRDPATFTDPHVFDPWRKEPGALEFGSSHHRCLGAPLARLELTVLFEELVRRNVRFALAGQPKRGWSNHINQLIELPLTVSSEESST